MIIYKDRAFKITQNKLTKVIRIYHKNKLNDKWLLKAKEYRMKSMLPQKFVKEYVIVALHMLEDLNAVTVVEFRASKRLDVTLIDDLKAELSTLEEHL